MAEATDPPPSKRSKTGAALYGTKFNPDWSRQFPFVSKGREDPVYSFYCNVCRKDVSCRHQGVSDIKRHEKCVSHSSLSTTLASTARLSSMGFSPVGSAVDTQVNNWYL